MKKWLDKYQSKGEVKKQTKSNFNPYTNVNRIGVSENTVVNKNSFEKNKQAKDNASIKFQNKHRTPVISKTPDNYNAPSMVALREHYNDVENRKKILKTIAKGADVVTDVMQVGNFIPHPIGQTIGEIGNIAGMGVDAFQAGMDLREGDYNNAAVNALSILPTAFAQKYISGFKRDMYNTTPNSFADKIANLGNRDGAYIPLTLYSKHVNNPVMIKSINSNRKILGGIGAETIYDLKQNGGLVSKNSLNRTVTCSNCGWSWKLLDGGENPLTCHKCGGTIKMKNGGEQLDQYQSKGQVNFRDQLLQRNAPIIDRGNFSKDYVKPIVQAPLISLITGSPMTKDEAAMFRAQQIAKNNNPGIIRKTVPTSIGTRTLDVLNNPMTSAQQAIAKQPITGRGPRNIYDNAVDFVNPFGMVNSATELRNSVDRVINNPNTVLNELPGMGLNLLQFLPVAKAVPKISRKLAEETRYLVDELNPFIKIGKHTFNTTYDLPLGKRLTNAFNSGTLAMKNKGDVLPHYWGSHMTPEEVYKELTEELKNLPKGAYTTDGDMSINAAPIFWRVASKGPEKGFTIIRTGGDQTLNFMGYKGNNVTRALPKNYDDIPKIKELINDFNEEIKTLKRNNASKEVIKNKKNELNKEILQEIRFNVNNNPEGEKLLYDFYDNYKPILDDPIIETNKSTGLNFPLTSYGNDILLNIPTFSQPTLYGIKGSPLKDRFLPYMKNYAKDRIKINLDNFKQSFINPKIKPVINGNDYDNFEDIDYEDVTSGNYDFLGSNQNVDYDLIRQSFQNRALRNNENNDYLESLIEQERQLNSNRFQQLRFKKGGAIITNRGQWDYPGQTTIIPSNEITMKGVPYPVLGVDNTGYAQMMQPQMNYTFPGQYVTEYPMAQNGKEVKKSNIRQAYVDAYNNYNNRTFPAETLPQRQKAYRTINPSDYTDLRNYGRWISDEKRNEFFDPRSEEAFKFYLGLSKPEDLQYIRKSQYRPTINATDKYYYAVDPELEQDIFNAYKNKVKLNETLQTDEAEFETALSGKGAAGLLGRFGVSKGHDQNGDYLSYYDKYDLKDFAQDRTKGVPYSIYNRIYYPKKQKGGQKSDWEIIK